MSSCVCPTMYLKNHLENLENIWSMSSCVGMVGPTMCLQRHFENLENIWSMSSCVCPTMYLKNNFENLENIWSMSSCVCPTMFLQRHFENLENIWSMSLCLHVCPTMCVQRHFENLETFGPCPRAYATIASTRLGRRTVLQKRLFQRIDCQVATNVSCGISLWSTITWCPLPCTKNNLFLFSLPQLSSFKYRVGDGELNFRSVCWSTLIVKLLSCGICLRSTYTWCSLPCTKTIFFVLDPVAVVQLQVQDWGGWTVHYCANVMAHLY